MGLGKKEYAQLSPLLSLSLPFGSLLPAESSPLFVHAARPPGAPPWEVHWWPSVTCD